MPPAGWCGDGQWLSVQFLSDGMSSPGGIDLRFDTG